MPKISELEIGTVFRYPDLGKTARLQHLGGSGAVVKYSDESIPVRVSDYSDVEVVSLPAGPVQE